MASLLQSTPHSRNLRVISALGPWLLEAFEAGGGSSCPPGGFFGTFLPYLEHQTPLGSLGSWPGWEGRGGVLWRLWGPQCAPQCAVEWENWGSCDLALHAQPSL